MKKPTIAIKLKSDDQTPAYLQIVNQVAGAILRGDLGPGDQIPSVRELSVNLNLTNMTVSKAFQRLRADGYITQSKGGPTLVNCETPTDIAAQKFVEVAKKSNYSDLQIRKALDKALTK